MSTKTLKASETALFIGGKVRNAWVKDGAVCAYLRLGTRYFEGKPVTTLEIANVNVADSKRNKGYFKQWFEKTVLMCRLAGIQALYVENVLSDVMDGICQRRGFVLHSNGAVNCYIKVLI